MNSKERFLFEAEKANRTLQAVRSTERELKKFDQKSASQRAAIVARLQYAQDAFERQSIRWGKIVCGVAPSILADTLQAVEL